MRAPAFARAHVPNVTVRFVDDFESGGIERRFQPPDNSLLHDQRFTPSC